MFRSLLAATLSLALALPLTAGTARADSRDVVKVIGGLVALYALKEVIERNQARPDRAAPVQRSQTPVQRPPRGMPRPHRDTRILPDQCHVSHRTYDGVVWGYGAQCMQNAVARPGLLPPQCIVQLQTDRGARNVYTPGCLRSQGWSSRTARR